jgi:uncharacterized membrane protein YfcA
MPLLHAINPLFTLAGLVVGMLVGFTGVGGGSMMTPLLVLGFGIPPATAVGTDLLYAGITNIGGSAVHAFHRSVVWRITLRLACGSLPAAALSLLLLAHLGSASRTGGGVITTTLGFALLITAAALIFRKWLQVHLTRLLDGANERTIGALTIVLGAVIGVLVTISSVGAGAIGATVLITLYPRLPIVRVVGSDIAHAVPLTLIAGLGHLSMGSVNGVLLVSLLAGSIPGIMIGGHYASRVPDKVLRPILAGVLAIVGGRLAF